MNIRKYITQPKDSDIRERKKNIAEQKQTINGKNKIEKKKVTLPEKERTDKGKIRKAGRENKTGRVTFIRDFIQTFTRTSLKL